MRIATIVFTYHRSEHTKQVLNALAKNDILPEKLYIFQDGVKDTTRYSDWKQVNELIKKIDWCDTEIHVSEKNMGLSKSVTMGINYVLQEYDAVIVLEDDCVPERQFMRFMVAALNTYKNEKEVYSVSGYAWDVDLNPQDGVDAYFNKKSCSWGWGTWKEKWLEYEEDYYILSRIKNDKIAKERLDIWGNNMESMLVGNIMGICDSWAVFWGLKIIEKGGYCLNPYKSLVRNIGFDGSGTHSGKLQASDTILEDEYKESFSFPEKVESTRECQDEFCFLFAGKRGDEKMKLYQDVLIQWIQMKQQGRSIQISDKWKDGVAVWGKGRIFDCLLSELQNRVPIKYIIESRPSVESYQGIKIISVNKLPKEIKNIIVIPYFDMNIIELKVKRVRPDICLIGINEVLV